MSIIVLKKSKSILFLIHRLFFTIVFIHTTFRKINTISSGHELSSLFCGVKKKLKKSHFYIRKKTVSLPNATCTSVDSISSDSPSIILLACTRSD